MNSVPFKFVEDSCFRRSSQTVCHDLYISCVLSHNTAVQFVNCTVDNDDDGYDNGLMMTTIIKELIIILIKVMIQT